MHHAVLCRTVEINRIRNVDRVEKVDPRAFIGNIADEARQWAALIEIDTTA
jgi:hypothetical protein